MNNKNENNSFQREFYFEFDQIPLHMKLDFPEGFTPGAGGKCPLVIVQHGFTGHMEEDHIIAAARALNDVGFATLRTELYGHGKSGGEFIDHTLFKWLSEMVGIIDYAKNLDFVSELYLIGHAEIVVYTVEVYELDASALRSGVYRQVEGDLRLSGAVVADQDYYLFHFRQRCPIFSRTFSRRRASRRLWRGGPG